MSIIALKNLIRERKVANLLSLINYFNTDKAIIEPMLQTLVCKGCIKKCTKKPACGSSCQSCSIELTEIYQWVG